MPRNHRRPGGERAPLLRRQLHVHEENIDYAEIRKTFSTPEGAKAFVAATGIDTFAAAVGNLHGLYPVPKQLDLDLLRQIRSAIDVNISLHGGSGTPGHFFQAAAQIGVSKINLNSDMRYAYRTTLEQQLRAHPEEYAIVRLMAPVVRAGAGRRRGPYRSVRARPGAPSPDLHDCRRDQCRK